MKGTKGLLILALPLIAVGCSSGSGTGTSPPPPPSVDPEGIYEGTTGNGGDTLFGIVAADGSASFLELSGDISTFSGFVTIIEPNAISPDADGNYNSTYFGYNSDINNLNQTGTFSGLASPASSLSGHYTNTGPIPSSIGVAPQAAASVNYNISYQKADYETAHDVSGNYSATVVTQTQVYSGGTFIITAGTSSTQFDFTGTDGSTLCNYSGTVTVKDTTRNAYEFSIQTTNCSFLLDNLTGMSAFMTINGTSTLVGILADRATTQGAVLLLTKN